MEKSSYLERLLQEREIDVIMLQETHVPDEQQQQLYSWSFTICWMYSMQGLPLQIFSSIRPSKISPRSSPCLVHGTLIHSSFS